MAVWLLSALPVSFRLNSIEWTNFALLLVVVMGSAIRGVHPVEGPTPGTCLGAGTLAGRSGDVHPPGPGCGRDRLGGRQPALVASHVLVLSLWASVITSATLVLWRDDAARTRERG